MKSPTTSPSTRQAHMLVTPSQMTPYVPASAQSPTSISQALAGPLTARALQITGGVVGSPGHGTIGQAQISRASNDSGQLPRLTRKRPLVVPSMVQLHSIEARFALGDGRVDGTGGDEERPKASEEMLSFHGWSPGDAILNPHT